jgi:hypothetical protein
MIQSVTNFDSLLLLSRTNTGRSYHIKWKGFDHLCEGCIVAPINQQSGNREGDQNDQAKAEWQGQDNAGGDG